MGPEAGQDLADGVLEAAQRLGPCRGPRAVGWGAPQPGGVLVAAQGLEVREVEIEGSCYEAYVRDKDGRRTKLYLDPMTLATVRSEKKS